jgi:hypothetical protein
VVGLGSALRGAWALSWRVSSRPGLPRR